MDEDTARSEWPRTRRACVDIGNISRSIKQEATSFWKLKSQTTRDLRFQPIWHLIEMLGSILRAVAAHKGVSREAILKPLLKANPQAWIFASSSPRNALTFLEEIVGKILPLNGR